MKNFLNKRVDLAYIVIFLFVALIAVLIYCKNSEAQEVSGLQNFTFTWEANTENDLAGYRLYRSDISGQYKFGENFAVASIEAGIETVTLGGVRPGYFVITAYSKSGLESLPSDEVSAIVPGAPKGLTFTITIVLSN